MPMQDLRVAFYCELKVKRQGFLKKVGSPIEEEMAKYCFSFVLNYCCVLKKVSKSRGV